MVTLHISPKLSGIRRPFMRMLMGSVDWGQFVSTAGPRLEERKAWQGEAPWLIYLGLTLGSAEGALHGASPCDLAPT